MDRLAMTRDQLVRGHIVTMDPQRPHAEAMAIRAGRILARGSVKEARPAAGAGAKEVGFDGGAIVPGLMDTHNHMFWTGMAQRLVDLTKCKSIAEIVDE